MGKKILPVALSALSILSFSCGNGNIFTMKVPKGVVVKSNARYELGVGDVSYDVADAFLRENLEKKIKTEMGSKARIFNYVPDSTQDVLTYLLHMPIYDMDLDISSYLNQVNTDDGMQSMSAGMNFLQTLELPAADFTQTQTVQFPDIADQITSNVESYFENIGDLPVAEGMTVTEHSFPEIRVSADSEHMTFDRMYYRAGSKAVIQITKKDDTNCSDDFEMFAVARIFEKDGITKLSESKMINAAQGGSLEIPMDIDAGFGDEFVIRISCSSDGGASPLYHTYGFEISQTSVIERITGVDADEEAFEMTEQDNHVEKTIDMGELYGKISNAVVGSGTVTVKAKVPVDSSANPLWTNVTCVPVIKLTGLGLDETFTDAGGSGYLINQVLDLAGLTLTPQDAEDNLKITVDYKLTLNNSTIILEEDASVSDIDIDVNGGVDVLSSVTIDWTSPVYKDVNRTYEMNRDSDFKYKLGFTDFVKKICYGTEDPSDPGHWIKHTSDGVSGLSSKTPCKGLGIQCVAVNSLPAGNSIPVKFESEIFNMSEAAGKNVSGSIASTNDKTEKEYLWAGHPLVDFTGDLSAYVDSNGDICADLKFNMFGESDQFTFYNLEPGKSYEFGIKDFALVQDWDYMIADLTALDSFSGNTSINSFNMDSMLNAIPIIDDDKQYVEIQEMPVYFYAHVPETGISKEFDDQMKTISLDGTLKLEYETDIHHEIDILDGKDVEFVPNLEVPSDSRTVIDQEYALHERIGTGPENQCSFSFDMKDAVNERAKEINITYDLSFKTDTHEEFTLYSFALEDMDLESNSGRMSIGIDAVIVIPFKFNAVNQVRIDFMTFLDKNYNKLGSNGEYSDLLMRDDASTLADLKDWTKSLKYLGINYSLYNYFIPDLDGHLYLNAKGKDIDGNEVTVFNHRQLGFEIGKNSVEFTPEELDKIVTTWPFHPQLILEVGGVETTHSNPSVITVSRNCVSENANFGKNAMGFKLILAMKMNGEGITVPFGKGFDFFQKDDGTSNGDSGSEDSGVTQDPGIDTPGESGNEGDPVGPGADSEGTGESGGVNSEVLP